MKKEEYEREDGTKGTKNILEPGDKIIARYDEPRVNNSGKYPSYSLGVTIEGEESYVQLTKGQYDKLMTLKPLTGKTIEAYEYENKHGKFTGVRVAQ